MAGPGTVSVTFLADAAGYEAALERMGAVTDAAGKNIADKFGTAGSTSAAKFTSALDSGTSRVGGIFQKLGGLASQFGIPFSSELTKIGKDLDSVETKARGVVAAMSAVGAIGVAAVAGVAVESVHLADGFDRAQSVLKSAVTNSGHSWDQYKGQVADAAKTSGALVVANAEEVDQALQELTTATQSPATALKDLSTAENIAAMKHISLADAAQGLVKVYGGSTRILQQWGINLDIGSAKLHSIQSAQMAVQKAQQSLNNTQAKVNDGQLQGVDASAALASAQMSLKDAQINYQQSISALPQILATLNQRTGNAAAALGDTLPGKIQIAKNEVHNLGIQFGEFLLPAIDKVLAVGTTIIGFFEKNHDAAIALGVAIGGPLAASMAVFAGKAALDMIGALGKIAIGFVSLAGTALSKLPIIGAMFQTTAAESAASAVKQISGLELLSSETVTQLALAENQWRQYAVEANVAASQVLAATGEIDTAMADAAAGATAEAEIYATQMRSLGISAQQAAAMVAEAEGAMVTETRVAAGAMDAAISSTLIGAGLVALTLAATELSSHWQQVWSDMKNWAIDAANAIDNNVINPIITAFDKMVSVLTLGFVQLKGQIGTLSMPPGLSDLNANSPQGAKDAASLFAAQQKAGVSGGSWVLKDGKWVPTGGQVTNAQNAALDAAATPSNLTPDQTIQAVQKYLAAQGFNPTAIAGILGNAQQESSMNPNTPGGGLFQQISNFGQGTGGSLQNQLNTMLPQIEGLKAALNAATTPAQAADIFEKGFERAGIPALANRENYANSIYSDLYAGPGASQLPTATTPGGGAPLTTLTPGDIAMENTAKAFMGQLQRAVAGGTSFSQQGQTVQNLEAITSAANAAVESGLVNSLNATQNPTLVALAQSIETTWQNATTKLTTIIDTDTTTAQNELQKLQSAATATSLRSMVDAVDSAAKASFDQLVGELVSTHDTALGGLVTQLEQAWQAAVDNLNAMTASLNTETLANAVSNAAALTGIKTTQAQQVGQETTQVGMPWYGTANLPTLGNLNPSASIASLESTIMTAVQAAYPGTMGGGALQSQQQANQLNAAATAIKDAATIQTSQAQAQTTAIKDAMAISNAAATAEATSIKDAATLMTDAANILVNSIKAQTTAMQDTSNAQVQALADQTQIQVDTLGKRGKYGLELVAQEAKIALDQQKAIDDAQVASAQAHLDQVTAQTNQAVAIAQQRSDADAAVAAAQVAQAQMSELTMQQANDAATARAQVAADAVQQQADATIAQAQAQADTIQIVSAISNANAQAAATAASLQAQQLTAQAAQLSSQSQFETGAQQRADQAQSQLLSAQAAAINAAGSSTVQAIQNQTSEANQAAANALQQAQAAASQQEAQAQAALSQATNAASTSNAQQQANLAAIQNAVSQQAARDAAALAAAQSNAQISQAQAQQQLAVIQTTAAVTEQKLTSIYNVDQELANVQYAGSGVNVYITGIPVDNASAIGAATSYAIRYSTAV